MKLEYLALDHSVERLVRRVPVPSSPPKEKPASDAKGKGKKIETGAGATSKKAFAQLVLGSSTLGLWPDGSSMSPGLAASLGTGGGGGGADAVLLAEDSEDEDVGAGWGTGVSGKIGLKVETMEGMRFCDVTGVRIFEKDVLGGRL